MNREKIEFCRIPSQGKIAGVCAGIAERFGLEVWLVRILLVTGTLLLGPFFVVAYVACWFILDPAPTGADSKYGHKYGKKSSFRDVGDKIQRQFRQFDETDEGPIEVKSNVWQAGELPKDAVVDVIGRYRAIERRLQNLETYVTSTEFTVSREISRL